MLIIYFKTYRLVVWIDRPRSFKNNRTNILNCINSHAIYLFNYFKYSTLSVCLFKMTANVLLVWFVILITFETKASIFWINCLRFEIILSYTNGDCQMLQYSLIFFSSFLAHRPIHVRNCFSCLIYFIVGRILNFLTVKISHVLIWAKKRNIKFENWMI